MIILIGGEKGGTGKSTLATNLAAMRCRRGRDALLIDADPQRTSKTWAEERDALSDEGGGTSVVPRVPCQTVTGRSFTDDVRDLARRYDDVVIDAGGRDSVELRGGLLVADVLYTPLQPSYADAWTMETMEDLVKTARGFNSRLGAYVVLSQAFTNPQIPETEDAIRLLREYDELHFSGVVVYERLAYRRALGAGLAVEEMAQPDPKAASELKSLYAHAFEQTVHATSAK